MIIVYLAHPISGDVKNNITKVEALLKWILCERCQFWPIAPYLDACRYLDDNSQEDRALAFEANRRHFETIVEELWICGARSPGVLQEIKWARELKIPIREFKDGTVHTIR